MSFVYDGSYQTAVAGSTEVVTLTPSTNTVKPFSVTIVGAVYGEPNNAVIAADKLSVSITMQAGPDNLFITVSSPNAADGALLTQPLATPSTELYEFLLTEHWDACNIPVKGVAAPVVPTAPSAPNS